MNLYDSIPALTGMLSDPGRNAIGALGERMALLLLQRRGYIVDYVARDRQRRGDLRVVDGDGEVIRVEVKTARQCKDGKWRFLLWKKSTPGKSGQDCRDADMLILLAVLKTGDVIPFVIPMAEARERSQICISSHPETYTGCWSRFRQRAGLLSIGGSFEETSETPVWASAQTATAGGGRQPRHRAGTRRTGRKTALAGTAAGRDGAANGALVGSHP